MTDKLITPKARLSYPALFSPRDGMNGGEKKYSCALIFDAEAQKTPEFAALKKAAAAAAKEKFGDKIPSGLRSPFRDGSEREQDGYGTGVIFINTTSKNKPGVVDQKVQPIIDEGEVYAGCYVRASVRPYAYDKAGNKGVSFGLLNVQKLADGEPLGSKTFAEDDFAPVDTGSSAQATGPDDIF